MCGGSLHTSFWLYTRSWRVPAIYSILEAMAALNNCKLWFSADSETRQPAEVPANVRVAFMQTDADDDMEDADLVFLDHPLRKQPISLTVLEKACPAGAPKGEERGTTCATCRICWVE